MKAFTWGQGTGRDLVHAQPDKTTEQNQPPYGGELKPKAHMFQLTDRSQLKLCITMISTTICAVGKCSSVLLK